MSKRYIVESDFMYDGIRCVVVLQSVGHRCGYVGIPEGHPLYCLHYMDELIDLGEAGDPLTVLEKFVVHGGITYAGGESCYPIKSDLWWFGFDCSHYADLPDYESAKKAFSDDDLIMDSLRVKEEIEGAYGHYKLAEVRTKEYVEEQCKRLAEQLSKYKQTEMTVETALKWFEGRLESGLSGGMRTIYEFVSELLRKEIENDDDLAGYAACAGEIASAGKSDVERTRYDCYICANCRYYSAINYLCIRDNGFRESNDCCEKWVE